MGLLTSKRDISELVRVFRSGNVLTGGTKGTGKDMLHSLIIRRRSKDGEIHAANIKYQKDTTVRAVGYYRLENNSRKNFVSDKFETETKHFTEREDYYISEAGLALPAHQNRQLEKEYPTFPIVYALSRHLGEFNIHANAQSFTRVWDKLREQADYFIWCESCTVIFKRIVRQKLVLYNRAETAYQHIQPFVVRRNIFGKRNKDDLAYAQRFNAKYGVVKRFVFWHILPKTDVYDTRIFYTKLYKKEAPFINGKARKQDNKKAAN